MLTHIIVFGLGVLTGYVLMNGNRRRRVFNALLDRENKNNNNQENYVFTHRRD